MARDMHLTRDSILAWVGETSLARGRPYVGRLLDQRRTSLELKARCVGSAAQPYRVTATLTSGGEIVASTCSCPVGGRCKHVAALLLAWLAEPDAFLEVEPLDAALGRRDKAELIALIRQMLARHPELETLLELPLPAAGGQRKPADPAVIRRQVLAAFRGAGDDWHALATIAGALGLAQGEPQEAQVGTRARTGFRPVQLFTTTVAGESLRAHCSLPVGQRARRPRCGPGGRAMFLLPKAELTSALLKFILNACAGSCDAEGRRKDLSMLTCFGLNASGCTSVPLTA